MSDQAHKDGIRKIKAMYKMGGAIAKRLPSKPASGYRPRGSYRQLAEKHGISEDKARKLEKFSACYSQKELDELIATCERHDRVIGFDMIIQLLPVRNKKLRKKLQVQAAREKWAKTRLRQEIKRLLATPLLKQKNEDQFAKLPGRGKLPKFLISQEALIAQLVEDAAKWHRSVAILKRTETDHENSVAWKDLSKTLQRDVTYLTKAFARFQEHQKTSGNRS